MQHNSEDTVTSVVDVLRVFATSSTTSLESPMVTEIAYPVTAGTNAPFVFAEALAGAVQLNFTDVCEVTVATTSLGARVTARGTLVL